jgi:hypothetical protein
MNEAPAGKKRCPQCWKFRDYPSAFLGKRSRPVRLCQACQRNYSQWTHMTIEERMAVERTGVPARPELRARLFPRSNNKKLGHIPSSITSRGSCPTSCEFYRFGCYALYGMLGSHWRRVGEQGDTWDAFCADVARLPEGTLWRHNVAGDLPGQGEALDRERFGQLVEANRGRRGFTYTHKLDPAHFDAYQWANLEGFTVNLSAGSLDQADRLFQAPFVSPTQDDAMGDFTRAGPVVVTLPEDAPKTLRTPMGRRVTVCPAQTDAMTCEECRLCAHPFRTTIVGFRAHGQAKRFVGERSVRRLPVTA